MERYKALMAAAQILQRAQMEVMKEDGYLPSPAWRIVFHAQQAVLRQADGWLRGEVN